MPALTAQHLRKSFGPQVVLEDATFTLARGERVGLIGANGAGKSTFTKILAGVETADGGSVSVRRGLSIRYVAQEPVLDPEKSAREVVEDALSAWRQATARHAEVSALLADASGSASASHDELVAEQATLDDAILHLGGWERGHEALGFLQKLGVRDVERPCGTRSGGERRRIALAQLLVASPDIAILDEPTNHLDVATAEWLEEYLAQTYKGALVLVTHDRYFLDAIAQRIVELERGKLTSYAGRYADYLEKKAELLAHEERVEQNRQNILRREREWLSRGPKARATKQKARIQRALALEARGSATAGRPGEVSLAAAATSRQGKTILELRGVQVAIPGGAPLNAPFDLILTADDRIGIVGPNGVGKTTLLRAVLAAVEESRTGERPSGAPKVVAGEIVVGKNTQGRLPGPGPRPARRRQDDLRRRPRRGGRYGRGSRRAWTRGARSPQLPRALPLRPAEAAAEGGGALRRRAGARRAREGAPRGGEPPRLRRADERSRPADARRARGDARRVPGVGARRDPRSGVPRSRRDGDPRLRGAIPAGKPATVQRHAGGYEDYVVAQGGGARAARLEAPGRRRSWTASPSELGRSTPATGAPRAERRRSPPPRLARGRARSRTPSGSSWKGSCEAIEAAEGAVSALEAELADPALYATRGGEVATIQARLAAGKAEATKLVARWELLETKKTSAR